MFGIGSSDFVILLVVAAVVLGPERLPHYAQQLGRLIRELRRMAQGATEQVRAELGPEFDEVDWRKLDPRQYDPRRIVRDALTDALDPDDPLGLKAWEKDEPAPQARGRHTAPDSALPGGTGTAAGGTAATGTAATGTGTARGAGPDQPGTRGGGPADVPFDPDAT